MFPVCWQYLYYHGSNCFAYQLSGRSNIKLCEINNAIATPTYRTKKREDSILLLRVAIKNIWIWSLETQCNKMLSGSKRYIPWKQHSVVQLIERHVLIVQQFLLVTNCFWIPCFQLHNTCNPFHNQPIKKKFETTVGLVLEQRNKYNNWRNIVITIHEQG